MPNALALVAHHDDHVLWMGGAMQRLAAHGWSWTVVATCIRPDTRAYFLNACAAYGAKAIPLDFQDYQSDPAFSRNGHDAMRLRLLRVTQGTRFDLVFTQSRAPDGEYGHHANHVEVQKLTTELVADGHLGRGMAGLAFFSYQAMYGSGTGTCARRDATHYLQLTYPELLRKCKLCDEVPDTGSLFNLRFPCPNPEAFEGEGMVLPESSSDLFDLFLRRA